MRKIIYLDYHSTTPCDPRVIERMLPYFYLDYANPSNGYHYPGRRALNSVEEARNHIAKLISAESRGIIFTSGATESNNLAIIGLARGFRGHRKKILTTPIEHKSVLKAFEYIQNIGFKVDYLPVDKTGTVILEAAKDIIDENTLLVSVQAANNEVGTIQPVNEIARLALDTGTLVHCDAAQAVGKIDIDVNDWNVDFLSISSHKLYGPKGVGALYIKNCCKQLIEPLFWGGDQEKNIRPGTYNVPGIVGFGEACRIFTGEMSVEANKTKVLRNFFEEDLRDRIPRVKINGSINHRLPGNSSITFPGVEGDALLLNLPELALSIGSACNIGSIEPSYVLTALGLSRDDASATVRIGIGRFTTESEIQEAVKLISSAYYKLYEQFND